MRGYDIIQIGILILIIYGIYYALKTAPLVLSHWYHLIENLQHSSQDFYASMNQVLLQRKIPELEISRITRRQGTVMTAGREYLRVSREEFTFDICAAPFGTGFFVSWWLVETMGPTLSGFSKIPLIGLVALKIFRPPTYYRYDTALMFQEMVRHSVNEAIQEITKARGLRSLTESEQKPILKDFFKR